MATGHAIRPSTWLLGIFGILFLLVGFGYDTTSYPYTYESFVAERGAVARQFRFLEVKDGAAVMEQGRPSEGLFVLTDDAELLGRSLARDLEARGGREILDEIRRVAENKGEVNGMARKEWLDRLEKIVEEGR